MHSANTRAENHPTSSDSIKRSRDLRKLINILNELFMNELSMSNLCLTTGAVNFLDVQNLQSVDNDI